MDVKTRILSRVHRTEHLTRAPSAYLRKILVLAAAAVVLAGVTVVALPASAEAHIGALAWKTSGTEVIDGCTVVLNPTKGHFTECADKGLSHANFSGLDLQFADFSKSSFVPYCAGVHGGAFCPGADFSHANLDHADLNNAVFASCCGTAMDPTYASANLSGTSMQQTDALSTTFGSLTGLDIRYANLTKAQVLGVFSRCDLTGANLSRAVIYAYLGAGGFEHSVLRATNFTGASVGELSFDGATLSARTNFDDAVIQYSDFTGTTLVPADRTVPASSPSGAVVKWTEPKALPGASPGKCAPASGSHFAVGATTVQCTINGARGLSGVGGPNTAIATFVVTVQ
jgi:uncharacterized protein YjbI with pentapeptide repeats